MIEFKNTMRIIHEHGRRVGLLSYSFAGKVNISELGQLLIYNAGRYHDFGKMAIPLEILNKPGKLTKDEFKIMQEHPIYSYILLKQAGFNETVLEMVMHHHEDWNGRGYPFRLAGQAIPLGAQILRLCDTYDALSEQRLYKPSISQKETIRIMEEDASSGKFNPELFEKFKSYIEEMDKDVEEAIGLESRNLPGAVHGFLVLGDDRRWRGSA